MFEFIAALWNYAVSACFICGAVSLLSLIVLVIYQATLKEQDLKKKYDASWAVVTGGSSGIGRAIVEKLAAQGINVVIVALDDPLLKDFHQNISSKYPKLQFRAVGADLSKDGYVDAVANATKDIKIQILFNNAGFVTIGLFADMALDRQLKNFEVNCVSSMKLTHWFLTRYMAEGMKRGAIFFTSSPAGIIPSPFAAIYGSTKAFVTEFAISVAGEVRGDGIDVLVVHPSPTNTNFYNIDSAKHSPMLVAASKMSYAPTTVASAMFSNIGKGAVIYEQGYWSVGTRFLLKFVDYNVMAAVTTLAAPYVTEYKKLIAERKKAK